MIRTGYAERPDPVYFADTLPGDIVHQPDVYAHAAPLATRLGATRIVDVGCGTAGKLLALADRFELTGIDYGPNIEQCPRAPSARPVGGA